MELSHSTAVISESGRGPAMVRRLEVKSQDFVVENYSSICKRMGVGGGIRSDEMVCGGHRWAVVFVPQGRTADVHNQGFTSVYPIRITQATHTVQYMVDIILLDQSPGNQHKLNFAVSGLSDRAVCYTLVRCDYFIRRSQLDSPHSLYLRNDSLKFRIRLGVFSYHDISSAPSSSSPYGVPSSCSCVSCCFRGPSEGTQLGDEFVFIRVADQTFCAAKCALADRCPKLLSYDHHHQLQDIVIPDAIHPCIFKVASRFISTGNCILDKEEDIVDSDPLNLESFAAKLLAATSMLELQPFKWMCEQELSNKICRESVASLLHLAHLCNASHLKSECLKFQAQDRLVMIKCDKFELLKENCPLLFREMAQASFQDNNPSTLKEEEEEEEGFTTLKEEMYKTIKFNVGVLKMYKTIKFKVGRHWPRFSANKYKKL